jgi:hypothetical protein
MRRCASDRFNDAQAAVCFTSRGNEGVAIRASLPDPNPRWSISRALYHGHSRTYGERVYLDFQIYLGEHEGKTIRMFLRPSVHPTSNFYRAWAMAHAGPPRSRNTKMSPRAFKGKLFTILTATVKPSHRIAGADGKMRPGPFLPESFWYSKVTCILALEATNEKVVLMPTQNTTEEGGSAPLHPPFFLTNSFPNPLSINTLTEGEVGRRELGDGSKRGKSDFAVGVETIATLHNRSAAEETSLPAPSPHGDLERQKEILRERGYLP